MSNQEIATMATVQEKVKERIQASFLDLIPSELWDGMVQQHLDGFTKVDLPRLVRQEAELVAKEMLKAEFAKPEWMSQWRDGQQRAPEVMQGILRDLAPTLVATLFDEFAMRVVTHIRNNRY